MTDQQLREALRALPPASPAPHFTTRVLARTYETSAHTHRRRLPAWAGAAAAALLLALGLGAAERHAAREQRRADLRRETEALRRELADLRQQAQRTETPLYLGGNDQVDVVLDVGAMPIAAALPAHAAGIARER